MIVPSDHYFIRREPPKRLNAYWAPKPDPDGEIRNLLSPEERRKYLEDYAPELRWVEQAGITSLLDVGCGPGWFLGGCEVPEALGVEICPIALQHCRETGVAVTDSLDHVKGRYDLVRCSHVIEHMEDPISEMDKMRVCCKKYFIMSTPDFGGPSCVRFKQRYRMLHDPTHISLFTNESMHRFLRDFGLRIIDVQYPFPRRYVATNGRADIWSLWDTSHPVSDWSPAWPGNWMTFYCEVC